MAQIKGGGKLSVLRQLYDDLDTDFKVEIDRLLEEGCGYSSLLRMLKIPSTSLLSPLVDVLIEKYNTATKSFEVNGHIMHVTLEDVLYLTGLPIRGKPVIADNTRDKSAFLRVFGIDTQIMTINQLCEIAKTKPNELNVNQHNETRMKAILLLIVKCMIAPKPDGSTVSTTYVQFIENLEEVNTFAWGAALLAFMQFHIENQNKRKSVCGCLWVLLGVFLLRIERLRNQINVQLPMENLRVPVLVQILEAVKPISNNHKINYEPVKELLNSLTMDDFSWILYNTDMLPPTLQNQAEYGTFVAPIFCNNYVVNHEPFRFHHQIEALSGLNLSPTPLPPITFHDNRGGSGAPNFRKHYERELSAWENGWFAQTRLMVTYTRRNRRTGDGDRVGGEGPDGGRVGGEGADGGSTTHNSQQNNPLIDENQPGTPVARSLSRSPSDYNYQNSPDGNSARSLLAQNSPRSFPPLLLEYYPIGSTSGENTSNVETLPHKNRKKKPRMEVTPCSTLPTLGQRSRVPPNFYSPKDSAMAKKQAKQEEIRKKNKRKLANEKKESKK